MSTLLWIGFIATSLCALRYNVKLRESESRQQQMNDEIEYLRKQNNHLSYTVDKLKSVRQAVCKFGYKNNSETHNVAVVTLDQAGEPLFVLKRFEYDPSDDNDLAFAVREAEELIDKLNE